VARLLPSESSSYRSQSTTTMEHRLHVPPVDQFFAVNTGPQVANSNDLRLDGTVANVEINHEQSCWGNTWCLAILNTLAFAIHFIFMIFAFSSMSNGSKFFHLKYDNVHGVPRVRNISSSAASFQPTDFVQVLGRVCL